MSETRVRLTDRARAAGCAGKFGPAELSRVLATLPQPSHPDLLVGTSTSDDAGVFRLRPDLANVQTVDFFAPIVDDPFTFGQVAAANALSDVYAMGGDPCTALNVAAFPRDLPVEILAEILRGGIEKAREAGVVVVGGHTLVDDEVKFGMAVTGTIHPDRIWRNVGARPGDVLILTKPLGTAIITTAVKRGAASPSPRRRRRQHGHPQRRPRTSDARFRRPRLHRRDGLQPPRPRLRDGARQRRRARHPIHEPPAPAGRPRARQERHLHRRLPTQPRLASRQSHDRA
jgi:selenide,water dikinase